MTTGNNFGLIRKMTPKGTNFLPKGNFGIFLGRYGDYFGRYGDACAGRGFTLFPSQFCLIQ